MARPRQPVDLIAFKGNKHLTKAEIAERKATEVKAGTDKVKPPTYLPKELKREFKKIANELLDIGIMTNLDVDALARFLLAKKMYLDLTNALVDLSPVTYDDETKTYSTNPDYADLLVSQDKLFKQSRAAASDLGLTISSRCKLVVPKKEDKKQESKFAKFGGGKGG
jgi:P27 family predicted phage terminase small subunit